MGSKEVMVLYIIWGFWVFFFLHNEDGSDISGGTSMFRFEVELPKHVKSEVIWGHLSERVQEAVEYLGLESKKKKKKERKRLQLVPVYLLLCNESPKT